MAKGRSRAAKKRKATTKDKDERPEKKVRFVDNVSNEERPDDENPEEELSDRETARATRMTTRQRAVKHNLEIKVDPPPKSRPRRNAGKAKNEGKNEAEDETSKPTASSSSKVRKGKRKLYRETDEGESTSTVTRSSSNAKDSKEAEVASETEDYSTRPAIISSLPKITETEGTVDERETEDAASTSPVAGSSLNAEQSEGAEVESKTEDHSTRPVIISSLPKITETEGTVDERETEDAASTSPVVGSSLNAEQSEGAEVESKTEDHSTRPVIISSLPKITEAEGTVDEKEAEDAASASTVAGSSSNAKESEGAEIDDKTETEDRASSPTIPGNSLNGDEDIEAAVESEAEYDWGAQTEEVPDQQSTTFTVFNQDTTPPDTMSNVITRDVMMEIIVGNQSQLSNEPLVLETEKEEEPLDALLMGLDEHTTTDVSAEIPENNYLLYVEATEDYVIIPTTEAATLNMDHQSVETDVSENNACQVMQNVENRNAENVDHEDVEMENANIQNIIEGDKENERSAQVKNININQPQLLDSLGDEVLMEAAKKMKKGRRINSKATTRPLKKKGKGKLHQPTKSSARPEVDHLLPLVQQPVDEVDETTCKMCDQKMENIIHHNGQPSGGFEESAAILDSRLLLFDGDGANVSTDDTRSYNKITSFSVYCKNQHLCHFDSGLIEKDLELYFSGYVKPIHSEDPSAENGVPGKKFGPIVWWWLTGFDIGEQPTVGFTTELGDYICMTPSDEYAPFMSSVMTKIYISKIVIEFLIYEPNASYEELMSKLQTAQAPNGLLRNFTEDTLLRYAPFVVDQVVTFDDTAKPKEQLLVTAPCIRRLIDLAGIKFEVDTSLPPRKDRHIFRERQFEHKIDYREKLLRQVAEDRRENSGASELIDVLLPTHEKLLTSHIVQPWRCDVCERCMRRSCRECRACSVKNFEACYQRRCFNREIMEENEEDLKDETDFSEMRAEDSFSQYCNAVRPFARHTCEIAWRTKPLFKDDRRTYYGCVNVDGQLISPGDFVDIRSKNAGVPPQILKVAYLYEDDSGAAKAHACFLWSGKYTVLGDITDRKELFFLNRCFDVSLDCVVRKVRVLERVGDNLNSSTLEDHIQYPYVCQRSYDPLTGAFHDLVPHNDDAREKYGAPYKYCWVCDRASLERAIDTAKPYDQIDESEERTSYGSVSCKNDNYHVGTAVYLKPKSLYFMHPMLNAPGQGQSYSKEVDEAVYSELYRKAKDEDKAADNDVPPPFDIGYITDVYTNSENQLYIRVVKLYRPENTQKGDKLSKDADVNVLFWSDEAKELPFRCVLGKCYLAHRDSVENVDEWSRQGPDRFCFSQIYKNGEFADIFAGEYGCPAGLPDAPDYPDVKLKSLNIFAGCGGLSLGLRQAGAAVCEWAIEADEAAAATFKLNNPGTSVFVGSCVEMMEKICKKDFKVGDQRLPKKGNVDLLCATLPSESWRDVKSVNAFKSSNIATFLVYLEYYQPPFFVLEADDVILKRSIVLKLALASFIRLGYQVAFDLLQVGNFGAPQDRLRTVIIGAAQGYTLPDCPKSRHVFSKSSCHGCVVVDNKMYQRRNWTESAPFRATTVRDAILDLAALDVENDKETRPYNTQSLSFYHRMMRLDLADGENMQRQIHNHVGKDLGALVQCRMSQIPFGAVADWRDLPNIERRLRDRTFTVKLLYSYDDPELGKGKGGQPRGVCCCSVGKRCDPSHLQENTLIPWHLVHSGKSHGHWAGLYGKLQWNGVFVGTTTNPEPLAKKAPVIHPSANRVLSVRECARAQGFPDAFVFPEGRPVHSAYRQIGLSTCPLLARAVGYEIAKSAAKNLADSR